MGYSYSSEHWDSPYRRFKNELFVKLLENIPQIMLVLQETFWNYETISFYKQVLPIIGLITAAINFSTNVGIAFAAKKVYVFFDDFKSKTLANRVDDTWLQYFK